ncbi:hypothetical protein [Chryseobacterium sp. HR92]|uniref:hypothetical protein n=1 Tax=Chryseobacterium sp. HR92 TaxID=3094839 RepID=UPI00388F9CDD|nr:hypothetical protein SFA27_07090 [Chryseobacterium sp. HR92]
MRKLFFVAAILSFGFTAHAQIGINTTSPKMTMDVEFQKDPLTGGPDNSKHIGLKAPTLTREQLTQNTAIYGMDQSGALVYITDVNGGDMLGQRVNMNSKGYYYFDGNVWKKMIDTNRNTTLFKAFKTGTWSLLSLTGGWNRVSIDAADKQMGAATLLNANGEYVVPSDGIYQIKYEFRIQGINANLLGKSYLGLIKNGGSVPIEDKQMDSVTLSLNLGIINLDLADVPVSGTIMNTVLELNSGDLISPVFKTGAVSLGLLTNKQVSIYIYKISDM